MHGDLTAANPEILNHFQKLFRLNSDFKAVYFQTIVILYYLIPYPETAIQRCSYEKLF